MYGINRRAVSEKTIGIAEILNVIIEGGEV